MAVAAAAAKMRTASGYEVGLPATTAGIPLGDLTIVIHDYNEQHYESNALARYFLNIAGRSNVNALIHGATTVGGEDVLRGAVSVRVVLADFEDHVVLEEPVEHERRLALDARDRACTEEGPLVGLVHVQGDRAIVVPEVPSLASVST